MQETTNLEVFPSIPIGQNHGQWEQWQAQSQVSDRPAQTLHSNLTPAFSLLPIPHSCTLSPGETLHPHPLLQPLCHHGWLAAGLRKGLH